jgi:hypothetical protein
MIKTICKKAFSFLVVFGLAFPVSGVLANNGDGQGVSGKPVMIDNATGSGSSNGQGIVNKVKSSGTVCERITERAGAFQQKAGDQENQIKTRNTARLTNWTTKENEQDAKLAGLRMAWDANLKNQFSALEVNAQTDAQKTAVTNFETITNAAVATRRLAVDSAIKTFRAGMQNTITTRQGQLDQLVSTSATSRQTLWSKAEADCAAGVDAKTVMANLKSGLQAIRTQTQTDKQNVVKTNTVVATLVAARKAAFDKAFSDFKATMEQARISLKKAFGSTVTTTPANTVTTTTPTTVGN